MSLAELFKDYEHIPKVWGQEIVLVNSPLYCAKLLCLDEGMQSSLHRHGIKTETFFILEGRVVVKHGSDSGWLHTEAKDPGDCMHLPAGTWHRVHPATAGGALILEVSMSHSDEDVERLSPSGPIEVF